jgi:hypothetical protein
MSTNATRVDIDEFLPPDTLEWCRAKLTELGFNPNTLDGAGTTETGARQHSTAYLQLRVAASAHIAAGLAPILEQSERPTGAGQWKPSEIVSQTHAQGGQGIDIFAEGRDIAAETADFEVAFHAET